MRELTPTDAPTPLRIGILGGGFMAAVHSRAARAAGARLLGLASSSPERARRAATELGVAAPYASAEALIDDPEIDVVHVCTPNSTHAALAARAITAGKHVICEKPLALDSVEAEALQRLVASSNVVAAVPFVYRYHPMVQEMRDRVRRGELGRLITVQGQYLQDWLLTADEGNWRVDANEGGRSRAFADIGSHLVDLLEFVTGERVAAVSAAMSIVHSERSGRRVDTEDVAAVAVRFDGGAVGTLLVSQTAAGHDNDLRIEVMGTRETVSFAQEQPDTITVGRRGERTAVSRGGAGLSSSARELSLVPGGHPMGYQDAFTAFVRDVYRAVRGDALERMPSFADGLRANVVADAVLDSSHAGEWTEIRHLVGAR